MKGYNTIVGMYEKSGYYKDHLDKIFDETDTYVDFTMNDIKEGITAVAGILTLGQKSARLARMVIVAAYNKREEIKKLYHLQGFISIQTLVEFTTSKEWEFGEVRPLRTTDADKFMNNWFSHARLYI